MASTKRNSSEVPVQQAASELAEAVRTACIKAALQGYEAAQISGLCHDGAWECAVSAIRMLDLEALVKDHTRPRAQSSS